jgi:hypothetical protein
MMKKIASIIILLITFGLSAKSQTNDAGLNSKTQMLSVNKAAGLVKHYVVIQLSSSDSLVWKGVLNNIKHLKDSWGDSVQIELVAHGPGIEMLLVAKATEQKKIAGLKKIGVAFFVCENTMKARNITKELIIPEAGFVPSGVTEIIMKQEQGWSYLKAGF